MHPTVTVTVRRPPGAVFELLADPRNDPLWNELVSSVELLDPLPVEAGTRYRETSNGLPYVGVIVSMKRPQRFVVALDGRPMRFANAFELRPVDGGTLVGCSTRFQTKTWATQLGMPLLRAKLARDLDRQLDGFRRFCESYAP